MGVGALRLALGVVLLLGALFPLMSLNEFPRQRTSAVAVGNLRTASSACADKARAETIRAGYEYMGKVSAVFALLVRDSATALAAEIPFVEQTAERFARHRVLVVEEDSVDGTKTVLADWASRNANVALLSSTNAVPIPPAKASGVMGSGRFQRLAALRNVYLDELHTPAVRSMEFLVVADGDLALGWDLDGIAHSFGMLAGAPDGAGPVEGSGGEGCAEGGGEGVDRPGGQPLSWLAYRQRERNLPWDAVCSNGRAVDQQNRFFDTLAFRSLYFNRGNWQGHEHVAHALADPPEEVHSCFGGLAIYRKSAIGSCRYSAGKGDCEHVLFNQCLRQHGKTLVFNPRQAVNYKAGSR
jgi:hypothetical protein